MIWLLQHLLGVRQPFSEENWEYTGETVCSWALQATNASWDPSLNILFSTSLSFIHFHTLWKEETTLPPAEGLMCQELGALSIAQHLLPLLHLSLSCCEPDRVICTQSRAVGSGKLGAGALCFFLLLQAHAVWRLESWHFSFASLPTPGKLHSYGRINLGSFPLPPLLICSHNFLIY